MFTCEALADPPHSVTWWYNGSTFVLSSNDSSNTIKYSINRERMPSITFGSLTIQNIQFSDHGLYQCTAINSVASVTASATLTVYEPLSILNSSKSFNGAVNSSATLYCVIIGFPLASVTWLKEGYQLTFDSNVVSSTQSLLSPIGLAKLSEINASFTGNFGVLSLLVFNSLREKDNGSYVCKASNIFGHTITSSPISLKVLDVPSAPATFMVSNYTADSVYLQFSAPNYSGNSKILGYNIYQRMIESEGVDTFHPVHTHSSGPYTTSNVEFNITSGILPYTKYELTIEACNMIGCGSSTLVIIKTKPGAPETPPQNCSAMSVNATAAFLLWHAPTVPNGPIQHYAVMYQPVESLSGEDFSAAQPSIIATVNNSTQLVLTDLLEATSYSFTLIAYTVAGHSPPSNQCMVYTQEDSPSGPPQFFKAEGDFPSSIIVSWTPPELSQQNGIITAYKLLYTTNSSIPLDEWIAIYLNETTLSYRFTGLQSDVLYHFSVAAATIIGFGPYSNTSASIILSPPGPPINVRAKISSKFTVTLSWEKPQDWSYSKILYYKVYYTPSKSYEVNDPNYNSSQQTIDVNNTVAALINLYASSTYKISVHAVNSAGIGTNSTVTIEMEASAPDIVSKMITNDKQKNTLHLTKPSNINGEISHYHIAVVLIPNQNLPSRLPDSAFPHLDSFLSYSDIRGIKSKAAAYIAVEFSDEIFPRNGQFIIGDQSQPNDRPNLYTNVPLSSGRNYTFFLRAYPKLQSGSTISQRSMTNRQYDVFTSSGYSESIEADVGDLEGTLQDLIPVIAATIVALPAIILIVAITIIFIVCFKRKRSSEKANLYESTQVMNPIYETYEKKEVEPNSKVIEKEHDLKCDAMPNSDGIELKDL